jgi:hypothetical protein
MNELVILHLSDLHYDAKHLHDLKIIRTALFEDLKNLSSQDKIIPNCIIFSGDLIFNGTDGYSADKNYYPDVKSFFIEPLLDLLKVTEDYFFITPGNHDVQRNDIDEYLDAGLKQKLISLDAVDSIIEDVNNRNDFLSRLGNFNRFKKECINNNTVFSNDLFTAHIFKLNNSQIGIGCMNSAWRSFGGDIDYGELLLGRRQVEQIADCLKDCSFKIAVIHHPIEYLKVFERHNIKLSLYKKFDMLLFGHLHEPERWPGLFGQLKAVFK